jgi:hypothetical protein
MSTGGARNPVVMVSSTVYGIENLLDQIDGALRSFGYEVWMSHKGTLPVHPGRSNFENCLLAVENCDAFMGIITPRYGSGRDGGERSITHRELLRAVELDKLRWFLVHEHVVFARQLLAPYRYAADHTRNPYFEFRPSKVMDDFRVIEMYEEAMQTEVPLGQRRGNWVQTYFRDPDALQFVSSQLGDVSRIQAMLMERSLA